jgi:DNA-binding NtrC family response regulator
MAKVLIVDDEPQVREILNRHVTDAGHETCQAGNTEEALAAIKDFAADVALCDVQMPGAHDGIWLTNQLRRTYPHTAVVLCTSVSDVPPATSMQAGVVAYVVKPFNRKGLLDALEVGVKWHNESVTAGPATSAASDALEAWFAALDN